MVEYPNYLHVVTDISCHLPGHYRRRLIAGDPLR
jgi:hypothetical protein